MGTKHLGAAPAIGDVAVFRNNYGATSNPTVNDDSGAGYAVGSSWVNITTPAVFQCEDATPGAANWLNLSAAGGGGSDPLDANNVIAQRIFVGR